MRIGLQTGSADLQQTVADCQQNGIDEIVLSCRAIPGLSGSDAITTENLRKAIDRVAEHGIRVHALILPNPTKEAVLGKNEAEVAQLCQILQSIGDVGVDRVLLYPFDRFRNYLAEYDHRKPPLEVMPGEEGWETILTFFRRISGAAEKAEVKVANHVFATEILEQVLDSVQIPNLGVNYCTGTYQFGYDPYATIRRYGGERIFLAHARNLVRHGPGRQGHEEVPMDAGDIDMRTYFRTLAEVGYDGLIIPEHWGEKGDLSGSVRHLHQVLQEVDQHESVH